MTSDSREAHPFVACSVAWAASFRPPSTNHDSSGTDQATYCSRLYRAFITRRRLGKVNRPPTPRPVDFRSPDHKRSCATIIARVVCDKESRNHFDFGSLASPCVARSNHPTAPAVIVGKFPTGCSVTVKFPLHWPFLAHFGAQTGVARSA